MEILCDRCYKVLLFRCETEEELEEAGWMEEEQEFVCPYICDKCYEVEEDWKRNTVEGRALMRALMKEIDNFESNSDFQKKEDYIKLKKELDKVKAKAKNKIGFTEPDRNQTRLM